MSGESLPEQLRRLGARRAALGEELRDISRELARAAVAAVAAGHTKTAVARDARITRATLDAWIRDHG